MEPFPAGGIADRWSVHMLWEGVLLLFVGAVGYLLHSDSPEALRGAPLRELMIMLAVVGLIAVGTGLTVRAAVVNLALGPLAYASAFFFADRSDTGLIGAALATAAVAIAVGLALVTLVVGFQIPAWAASLGAALAVSVWVARQPSATVVAGAYHPTADAVYWGTGVLVLTVGASLVGLLGPVRRTIGAYRPERDPALRPPASATVGPLLALTASSALAAVAGILIALASRKVTVAGTGEASLLLGAAALGAVLLGGTSAFGRRGGLFGTALGTSLVVLACRYVLAQKWEISQLAIAAGAIVGGLVVTRLVETFGRPHDEPELSPMADLAPGWDEIADEPVDAVGGGWGDAGTGGWTAQLSNPVDDAWGADDRWGAR